MKKIITLLLAGTLSLAACDLERLPNGSMAAEDIISDPNASLEALLNGSYAQMKGWSDPMHRCGEYAGDNVAIRGFSTDAFFEFISYTRTPANYRLNSFWNNSYKAIAQASNVIKMIDEGQSKEVDNQIGECYFIRGMMYFYLCRAYGRPYYDNPDENLGIPIVNGTPDDVFNLQLPDRSTVKASYRQAIDDLKKSTELMTINKGAAFASKEAAQALLSRIYLYMSGTYDNPDTQYADSAVWYSTEVIKSQQYSLLSRENFMKYNEFTPEDNDETIFAVKRLKSENMDLWNSIGGFYCQAGGQGWAEMYASQKYLDLLDENGRNDWRPESKKIIDARANFIQPQYAPNVKDQDYKLQVFRFVRDLFNKDQKQTGYLYMQDTLNYNKATGDLIYEADGTIKCWEGSGTKKKEYVLTPLNKEQQIYTINYADGKTYTGVIDYKISLNRDNPMFYIVKCSYETGEDSQLHSPIISRLGEIYLNRAEAYAKLGKYTEALGDLNTIRIRSIVNGAYASLDANNAAELIDKERQLELAFQAERSYDVYRNSGLLTRHYPGAHEAMIEVDANDYRVVYFIPQDAINSYSGTLTQNPTSN